MSRPSGDVGTGEIYRECLSVGSRPPSTPPPNLHRGTVPGVFDTPSIRPIWDHDRLSSRARRTASASTSSVARPGIYILDTGGLHSRYVRINSHHVVEWSVARIPCRCCGRGRRNAPPWCQVVQFRTSWACQVWVATRAELAGLRTVVDILSRRLAHEMADEGIPVRDIASVLDVSFQHAAKLAKGA